jgi:hypothetical protein
VEEKEVEEKQVEEKQEEEKQVEEKQVEEEKGVGDSEEHGKVQVNSSEEIGFVEEIDPGGKEEGGGSGG